MPCAALSWTFGLTIRFIDNNNSVQYDKFMATFYSTTEAAEELGVSRQRVSRLCTTGVIKSTKVGKFRFPHKASVEKYKTE
jgi:excisionase family DNA binding protein